MRRIRHQATVTSAIDVPHRSYGPGSQGQNGSGEHLRALTERLRVATGRTAANGAVVAGPVNNQVGFIRGTHSGGTFLSGNVPGGVRDFRRFSDSLRKRMPGTALLGIAAIRPIASIRCNPAAPRMQ